MRFTGHFESEILAPSVTRRTRRSGALGRRSRFAARPLGWSDLDRLLELADGPAPCQISIPAPIDQGHPSSCDGHRVDLDAVQRTRYIAMGCSRIRQGQLSHWIQPG